MTHDALLNGAIIGMTPAGDVMQSAELRLIVARSNSIRNELLCTNSYAGGIKTFVNNPLWRQ